MKNKHFFLTLIGFLFCNTIIFSQMECGDVIHGIESLLIINCSEDVFITSLEKDSEGTVVQGTVETSGRIDIVAGHSSVIIIPYTNHSHRMRKQLSHTTKVGNGGNVGNQKQRISSSETITIHPNPIINTVHIKAATNPIIGYQITNLYGNILKTKKITPTKSFYFSAQELPKGMYLIKIQLTSGKQHIKTIIKN